MSLPKSKSIAGLFALAGDYNPDKEPNWPRWATPKLNGIRAMWVPGAGFFSKDGIPYEACVLPHLEWELGRPAMWLDGELYVHGMTLQQINARAGVIRTSPHEDHLVMRYHVFDAPQLAMSFEERQNILRAALSSLDPCIQHVPFKRCDCREKANTAHRAYVSAGYEGTVYKDIGGYIPGRSTMMLKRKAWLDEDYEVVALIEGEGKYLHTLGAIELKNKAGTVFKVGSFELTDDERQAVWDGPRPAVAKVRYMSLTDAKIPHNARVTALT